MAKGVHTEETFEAANEFQALLEAHRAGRVDNARTRMTTGLDTLSASSLLRGLRDRHLLRLHPAGGASYYTLSEEVLRRFGDRGEATSDREGRTVSHGAVPPPDRAGLGADRGGLEAPAGEPQGPGLSDTERQMMAALGDRPRKDRLRQGVQSLARRRPWRPAELARALGRTNVEKLTERHLKPMVADRQLRRTHPDQPSHPEQAYYAPMTSGPLFDADSDDDVTEEER